MKFRILNVRDKDTGKLIGKKFQYSVIPFVWSEGKVLYLPYEMARMEHDMVFALFLEGKVREKDVYL